MTTRHIIVGIYREKEKLVVRKYEEIAGIKVCLDEQYALDENDAVTIQNNMVHELYKFRLN